MYFRFIITVFGEGSQYVRPHQGVINPGCASGRGCFGWGGSTLSGILILYFPGHKNSGLVMSTAGVFEIKRVWGQVESELWSMGIA